MTAKILALPNAAEPEPRPRFDLATATEAETAAWLAGRQSVIDDLMPLVPLLRESAARCGVHLRPNLSVAS
ncbi:hypothetical protein K1W54_04325 [Micromonospora sp. CPCC 205371]|nr:hypothetical protein [Micromonospora sp. CPCC 205371]